MFVSFQTLYIESFLLGIVLGVLWAEIMYCINQVVATSCSYFLLDDL